MLACQRLSHRLRYPILLEHPSSRSSVWERQEAVYEAVDGTVFRCGLDGDPHIRLPPTTLHGVLSRFMPSELDSGNLLPRDAFHRRMGFSGGRAIWDFRLVHFSCRPNSHRLGLAHCHLPEER